MAEPYDTIGRGYGTFRRADPRIAARIVHALGDASSVVNVGASTGSYEPSDRPVIAVEPAMTMIRQRPTTAAPVVCASAARLPFKDASFDASLAVLTVHHWPDRAQGLNELHRTARRNVTIFTWDPAMPGFWLSDYFPAILDWDRRVFPSVAELHRHLGTLVVSDVPVPYDCTDGFLGAYWRRPAEYLRADVRAAISTFARLSDLDTGLGQLQANLASGEWHRRYGRLLSCSSLDLGYRVFVALGRFECMPVR